MNRSTVVKALEAARRKWRRMQAEADHQDAEWIVASLKRLADVHNITVFMAKFLPPRNGQKTLGAWNRWCVARLSLDDVLFDAESFVEYLTDEGVFDCYIDLADAARWESLEDAVIAAVNLVEGN